MTQKNFEQLGEIVPSGRVVQLGRPGHGPTFSSERPATWWILTCWRYLRIVEKVRKIFQSQKRVLWCGLSNISCFATKLQKTFLGCHVKLFKQLLYVVPVVVISPYRPYQAKGFQAVHGASAAALSRLAWRFSRSVPDPIKHGYGMYYIHDITHYLVHNMTCTYI